MAVAVLWAAACGDSGPETTGPTPAPNRGPEAVSTIAAHTVSAGETATVDVSPYFRDPDGDALSYAAASSNAGVAGVSMASSSVTVTGLAKGAATVTVEARDPQGLLAQQRFQVTVPNRIPEAVDAIPAQTVFVGETVSVDASVYFRDPDGDPLTYSAVSANADVVTAVIAAATITIRAVATGVTTVTVRAEDPDGGAVDQVVQVTVPNRGPGAVGSMPAHTVSVGETVTVDASSYFSDPDGDALSYAAASSNTGVSGVSVAGRSVAVTALAKGVATITVEARDPHGLIAQQRFQVTVPNRTPEAVNAIPAQTVFAGQTASVDVSSYFRDPDGDPLTYSATSSAAAVVSVSISGSTLTLTGVAAGTATVTVTARDPDGLTATQDLPVTVETSNRAPEAVGTIPNQTVATGQTATVDASSYFRDPDGDRLTYTAASNNAAVATATVSGSRVTITAVAAGAATVTVTATDPDGLAATSSFGVTVETPAAGSFHIELVFTTSVTRSQEAVFRAAAERWMKILAPTELTDVRLGRVFGCGDDPSFHRHVETIDDLMIEVAVGEIDGPGGILGQAGPCGLRQSDGGLPFAGHMELDAADLERKERDGDLDDLVLHEMGHVLGIGTLWRSLRFDLLRNPASETASPDTHFVGPLAIGAFDEAGGTSYSGGAKVPVENTGGAGTRNSHWRRDVFGMELMIGWADGTATSSPVSAITVQSLADLGYAVDVTAADPYTLPGADAARLIDDARRIPYGDDIWRGPIVVVDPDGRIVRVIGAEPPQR